MSSISKQQLETFYAQHQDEARYANYSQDFETLAADGSIEYRELLKVLNSEADYEKKRIAYEIIQKCFLSEAAGVSAPQPSWWDSATTAAWTRFDHYTQPFTEAYQNTVDTYHAAIAATDNPGITDYAKGGMNALWNGGADRLDDTFTNGFTPIVNYLNPQQPVAESADKVMQQDFEAGNRASATYAVAAAARSVTEVQNNIVGGAAGIGDLVTFAPAFAVQAFPNLVATMVNDYFYDPANQIAGADYMAAITDEVWGYQGAYGTLTYLGHALRLGAKTFVAVPYAAAKASQDPTSNSALNLGNNYVAQYQDFTGNDLAPLIGLDPNDPDGISRTLRVGSTLTALGLTMSEGSHRAVEWKGDVQYNRGLKYINGKGVPRNNIKAFELFEKAAAKGNPDAQLSLGRMYEFGVGVKLDLAQAREWYQKAAEQGDLWGQQCLEHLNKVIEAKAAQVK